VIDEAEEKVLGGSIEARGNGRQRGKAKREGQREKGKERRAKRWSRRGEDRKVRGSGPKEKRRSKW